MQHIKKQMGQNENYKRGTPKSRNAAQVGHNTHQPNSGGMPGSSSQSRIKSSRASTKNSQPPSSSQAQQRAITPKQNQKVYQSITIAKNNE